MKFVKLVRDYENKKYKDISYCVKDYVLYTRANPLLNSWGLLPVPSRLWVCDSDSVSTFSRPLDVGLQNDSAVVLVRRPASLVRTRTRWQLNPRGVYRLHGAGGCTGTERGAIREFSRPSQTRLQRCIDSYDVKWGSFITLTFSAPYCEERRTLKNGVQVPVGRWSPSWNTGHGDFLHSFAVRYDKKTRIPTLDEVFDLLKNTEMTINIELKNGIVQYKNLEKKVLALVEEYDMLDRIWCSSFNHESIVRMKKLCPDMRCGLLFSDIIVNAAEYAGELHVDALHPATYHMQDENYIDKAHGRGLRAHVWTVNEKHEMKALVKAEADAIITNYPDIAVEIVKNE